MAELYVSDTGEVNHRRALRLARGLRSLGAMQIKGRQRRVRMNTGKL